MIQDFVIGTLPGQYAPDTFIQDSFFENYKIVYALLNNNPFSDFTQSKSERRLSFTSSLSANDVLVVHAKSFN